MNLEGLGGGRVVYFHNKIPCTALEKKRKSLLSWLLTQCGLVCMELQSADNR